MQTISRSWSVVLTTALVLSTFAAGNLRAQDPPEGDKPATDPTLEVSESKTSTRIVERFAKIIELDRKIRRVDGFDPEVLNVTGIQGRADAVRVHALSPGVTTLVLTDENDKTYTVEVFVTGDVRHLQAYLERMFPASSVEAVEVQDSVVLRGWVTQPAHITEIVEIAEQFYPRVLNQMTVGGNQQVQLKVRVMEVQRSKIRRLGFNFLVVGTNGFLASTPGALVPLTGIANGVPAINSTSLVDSTITGGIVNDNFTFNGFLEALKAEGLLKILAEPELVTTNGRPANMLAGGEFPILVPQSLGTVTIEWREFGVRLEAVPQILGRGRVRLELQPEVSERDFTNAVDVQGVRVPGLTTRRVNTQVEMAFGETFVIAGLLSMRKTADTNKVPLLGEIPWIGAAFRRETFDETESELVIMVTPELVSPLQAGQLPPGGPGLFSDTPLDRDFYRDGMLEVPTYGGECPDCQPPYGDGAVPPGHAPAEGSPQGQEPDGPQQLPLPETSSTRPRRGGPIRLSSGLVPPKKNAASRPRSPFSTPPRSRPEEPAPVRRRRPGLIEPGR